MPAVSIEKKAAELLRDGKIKLEATGGRAIYFSVEGETESHQVSFEPAKKSWSCDCKYTSVHPGRECSHIIAARLFLRARA
jgi:hypothetical protein